MKYLYLIVFLIFPFSLRADEGMWMINAINEALEKKMQDRGLALSAEEIYNADAEGASLSDAVVSLDFGCTGSIISRQGLLITNHHCAYSDVHSISTPEHNFLEDGFWAMKSSEERNIPGKKAWFLKKVIDVTDEVNAMLAEAESEGRHPGFRKISWQVEKKYKAATGHEASLGSMWAGAKYYLSLYEVYSDVRLVAAPPVSFAAFGGDIDNWEWPQHKCDFALYRIYTAPDGSPADYSPENVPLVPSAVLDISLDGYRPGDFTMVIGYPGSTDRYSPSYTVRFKENVTLPVITGIRGAQMEIINRWMNADPAVRLKYSDYYFGLSNVQELNDGERACYRRFGVAEAKACGESGLQSWIDAEPGRKASWGALLDSLGRKYDAVADMERNIAVYRETLVRGTQLARANYRLGLLKNEVLKSRGIRPRRTIDSIPPSQDEIECCKMFRFKGKDYDAVKNLLLKGYDGLDLRVERDLFRYAAEKYYTSFDSTLWGPYQKELYRRYSRNVSYRSLSGTSGGDSDDAVVRGGFSGASMDDGIDCLQVDYDAICSVVWDSSFLTDTSRLHKFISEDHTLDEYLADPFFRFMQDVKIADLNRLSAQAEGRPSIVSLNREYTHALRQMRLDKGVMQYPDANSTMRITYGTVDPLEPSDGILCSWRSTTSGILEKYDPSTYEFDLKDRQLALLEAADWGRWFSPDDDSSLSCHIDPEPSAVFPMYVNFLTDNDITGGNSGSPVLNSEGRLIGLAFDGNKESLAGTSWYSAGYNKCVCVDIRYVLWTLDRYAGLSRILDELQLQTVPRDQLPL